MNFANCYRLVSLLMYCSVAVLVTVTGQSTTDDDIDKDVINRLVHVVEVLKAEQEELRAELATTKDQLASKFSHVI